MIKKFVKDEIIQINGKEIFLSTLGLSEKDTIVAYIEKEVYDIDIVNVACKVLEKAFPQNTILILPTDIKLGVITSEK